MRKYTFILVLLSGILATTSSYAQFIDWSTKFGLRGSLLFPQNEFANLGFAGNNDFSFDWFKFSYLGETYLGVYLSKKLELQLTIGLGAYAGKAYFDDPAESYGEYKSLIIPFDLRLKVSPWLNDKWIPYFYFGAGIMSYDLLNSPSESIGSKPIGESNRTGRIPLGIGTELVLSETVLLDFSIGGAISTSYELDGYKGSNDGIWDSYISASMGITLVNESCDSDRDSDKLERCYEESIGTDPKNPDTDSDGLSDGEEALNHKTDPLKVDTDDDSLTDYDEIVNYKTDPLNKDTDLDQLTDGAEILNYKTDPLKPDTENDDLNDYDEIMTYLTDPLRSDTDSDGLSDGGEVLNFKTDPLIADTDGEGLSDGEEVINYRTDPNNIDTDAGSVDDFTEVKRGTNPINPADDIIEIDVPIILDGITFETGKDEITPESEIVLQGALNTMEKYEDIIVEIGGHTDDVGSVSNNLRLSQKRADSVRSWLINNGIEPDRIVAKGYGEEFPKVPNDSAKNKRLNRRIEFKRIR